MAKELHTTIKIDGEDYNVNAKQADHVKSALIIKNIGLTGSEKITERVTFTGNDAAEVSIVSAETGGRFNKEIRVPAATNIENINKESVLNYNDTINLVLNKIQKGAISYSWNGTEVVPSADITETNTFNYISIVTGEQGTSGAFASWNYDQKAFGRTPYVPIYLYIELREDKNDCITYFGTADSKTAIVLAINSATLVEVANTANKVANELTIQLNGGTTEGTNKYTFNGSIAKDINITPENIGATTLISENGDEPLMNGTATVGGANTAARSDHVHPIDTSRAAEGHKHAAGDINSGVLAENCGGTGKTKLTNVTVGTAEIAKTIKASGQLGTSTDVSWDYYNIKFFIGKRPPNTEQDSGHPEGSIWVYYK